MAEIGGAADEHDLEEDLRDKDDNPAPGIKGGSKTATLPYSISKESAGDGASAGSSKPAKKKAQKVADSWEDEAGESGGEDTDGEEAATPPGSLDDAAWNADAGEGLVAVTRAFAALQKAFNKQFEAMWA